MKPNLKKKKLNFSLYWMYAIIILVLVGVYYLDQNSITKPVTYSEFEKYVTEGGVEKIVVYTNKMKRKHLSPIHWQARYLLRASTRKGHIRK